MLLKRAYTREQFENFISECGWQTYEIAKAPLDSKSP